MSNKEKYNQAFFEAFSVDEAALEANLEYNTIPEWDSIGHMSLIAELEDGKGDKSNLSQEIARKSEELLR